MGNPDPMETLPQPAGNWIWLRKQMSYHAHYPQAIYNKQCNAKLICWRFAFPISFNFFLPSPPALFLFRHFYYYSISKRKTMHFLIRLNSYFNKRATSFYEINRFMFFTYTQRQYFSLIFLSLSLPNRYCRYLNRWAKQPLRAGMEFNTY